MAIEIDDEGSHYKSLVASGKFYDDLLKQNSMIYMGWDVYRWAVRQMQLQPELVKDEFRVFLGSRPRLREIEDYLPTLVEQAAQTFQALWSEVKVGRYLEAIKEADAHIVCGSVQSVALHLERFKDDEFDYLIIDEAHHAAADTYQKILAFLSLLSPWV